MKQTVMGLLLLISSLSSYANDYWDGSFNGYDQGSSYYDSMDGYEQGSSYYDSMDGYEQGSSYYDSMNGYEYLSPDKKQNKIGSDIDPSVLDFLEEKPCT